MGMERQRQNSRNTGHGVGYFLLCSIQRTCWCIVNATVFSFAWVWTYSIWYSGVLLWFCFCLSIGIHPSKGNDFFFWSSLLRISYQQKLENYSSVTDFERVTRQLIISNFQKIWRYSMWKKSRNSCCKRFQSKPMLHLCSHFTINVRHQFDPITHYLQSTSTQPKQINNKCCTRCS